MSAAALATVAQGDAGRLAASIAMRRARARQKARRDVMEALVEVALADTRASASPGLRAIGSTRSPSGPSALLARAQARADVYAEILATILPLALDEERTPAELHRAVHAICERIVADYVRVTVR